MPSRLRASPSWNPAGENRSSAPVTTRIGTSGQARKSHAGDSMEVSQARTERPAVTIETDVATLRAITLGRQPMTVAERDGRLRLTGDRGTAERFTRLFRVPS